jgi:hypothetical protein
MLFNTTRKTSGLHTGARYRMDAARRCNALNTAPKVYSPSYRYCGVGRPGRGGVRAPALEATSIY